MSKGELQTEEQELLGCLSKLDRERIESAFGIVAAIMRKHAKLRLTGGWQIEKPLLDGRTVVHKFEVGGYFRGAKVGICPHQTTYRECEICAE